MSIQNYDRSDLDVYTMKDLVSATLELDNELKQAHSNLTAIGEHHRAVKVFLTVLLFVENFM